MNRQYFITEHRIQLYDTDAAGRLFFAQLFRLAHDAYEDFMERLGFPLARLIAEGELLLPLIHAEADYLRPLHHGEHVRLSLTIAELRQRSFAVAYRVHTPDGTLAATARTVHVQIRPDGSPGPGLPAGLRAALGDYREADA
ncbi:MAG: acyl-CoA thioesterase [Sphingobacteriia bacterium]|nr:acyl-CoA thioesterase [Sphingobacteriia bacterium]NCC40795.1 acyl-CoA thioesterase [Gammaproteobacteria bacterium]